MHGKRGLNEDEYSGDEKEVKKSRLDSDIGDDEDIDDTEYAPYYEMEVDRELPGPSRGSKRAAAREDDEGFETERIHRRGKRARRVSGNKSNESTDQDMEETDDIVDLTSIPRGKKRDRVEAGSSFGGDDSGIEDDLDEKPRHHRRRRVHSGRKSDTTQRGQKRSRDMDESDEEDTDGSGRRATRQRREQQSSEGGSTDDRMVSHDPLCKGRRVGEEWEVNGVKYRVGLNGQRLRQALVKQTRSRFPMVCRNSIYRY